MDMGILMFVTVLVSFFRSRWDLLKGAKPVTEIEIYIPTLNEPKFLCDGIVIVHLAHWQVMDHFASTQNIPVVYSPRAHMIHP